MLYEIIKGEMIFGIVGILVLLMLCEYLLNWKKKCIYIYLNKLCYEIYFISFFF